MSDSTTPRAPVIAVMGHIDHGKSKLLDKIRTSNVVEGEAGGITQAISAYEVEHESAEHGTRRITFLDTPGHEAFRAVRAQGAEVADIAILVVAADEGVKPQTIEALETIKAAKLPYIVALTKIDKPEADLDRAKNSLLENEIYIEGYGGDVPYVPLSSISGEGVADLLDMILLVADLEELTGEPDAPAEGVVIETNLESKTGISASIIIKNGTLRSGEFVVAGSAWAPVRIMENFLGEKIQEASFSMPIRIVGFSSLPELGSKIEIKESKRDAEKQAGENKNLLEKKRELFSDEKEVVLPLVIRADAHGSIEAIRHEIGKIEHEDVAIKIIDAKVGSISENDLKLLAGSEHATIIGFNARIDAGIEELAGRSGIAARTFSIIYKLAEWLEERINKIAPKRDIIEVHGRAKVLKNFSKGKNKQLIGGRVTEGALLKGTTVRIIREDEEIARGTIINLQVARAETDKALEESEFGAMIGTEIDIESGDVIEAITITPGE